MAVSECIPDFLIYLPAEIWLPCWLAIQTDTDDIVLEELLADHRDRKPRHSNSFVFEEQTDSWCIDHCRYEYSCCDICCDSLFNYICIINKPYLLDSTKLHSGGWLLRWLSQIPSG